MSKRTAEERAAYWKKQALAKKKYNKNYNNKAKYVKAKSKAAQRQREATKESGVISAMGSALGGVAGTLLFPEGGMIGGVVGSQLGDFLGGKLGHLIEKITGFGDYKVASNSIMNGGMTPPQIVNSTKKGGFIIRHREYMGEVYSTKDFTITKYPLNPGQSITFPWLSQIAANFDQYRFRGVLFEFKSTSSDAVLSTATSSALGSVSMATDYDALDDPYTNKREMLNSLFANSSKPSCTFIHPIECKRSQTPMQLQYVRSGSFPPNSDARMYDLGNFYLATEGMQADGGTLGELWVTYEVEFFKQQIASGALTDHFKIDNMTGSAWLAPTAANHPGDPANVIGGKINDAGVSYLFPNTVGSGKFLFTWTCFGTTGAAVGAPSITVSSNAELIDLWNAGAFALAAPPIGTTSSGLMVEFVVQLNGPSAIVTFGTSAIPGGTTTGDLMVTKIEDNMGDF